MTISIPRLTVYEFTVHVCCVMQYVLKAQSVKVLTVQISITVYTFNGVEVKAGNLVNKVLRFIAKKI